MFRDSPEAVVLVAALIVVGLYFTRIPRMRFELTPLSQSRSVSHIPAEYLNTKEQPTG